jgi:tellurite resistance protein TerC
VSTYTKARRVVVAVVGSTVLLVGVVMLVAPGPGIVVIPLGLAILGLEFAWARYWLRRVREKISGHNADSLGAKAEQHRDRVR